MKQAGFLVKKVSYNSVETELKNIGFDSSYLSHVICKYTPNLIKIFDLTLVQANILKQTALSCGTDCALNKGVLTNCVEKTDVLLFATDCQLAKITAKLSFQQFKMKDLAEELNSFAAQKLRNLKLNGIEFNFEKPYLMGILNITDNSFSDGGKFLKEKDAISHYKKLIADGADIIDIGAESTAPNSSSVSSDEEINRLKTILPLIREIDKNIPISIDTRNAKTAEFAINCGINLINDVSGLTYDKDMVNVVAQANLPVVLTFDGEIKCNVVDETIKGLLKRVDFALENGISENNIVLDAGLGFNKTLEQNFELIKYSDEICSMGFPVLYGVSRKSFVQKTLNIAPLDTEFANVSLASYLIEKGVNILRVHDVKSHKQALDILKKVL